jgi:ribonuclease D
VSGLIKLVDQVDSLASSLALVTDDIIGVDVERADSHRYHRTAALVQVGDADACVLLDPLAVPDPVALATMCQERTVVLHALENDLAPMEALGVRMPKLHDSAIAAGLLGLPVGLGDLLSTVVGVELTTDKSKYQRADWEKRPLSQGMIDYAAGDVFFLPELWRALETQLREAGRWEWYEQELEATIAGTYIDSRHWEKVKGSGRLEPEQRSILRSLWDARESICREEDIAPNRLIHDKTLLDLALKPAASPQELERRDPQRRRGPIQDHADELFRAQEIGIDAEPEERAAARRWSDAQRDAYDALRDRRSEIAEGLGIDAGLLCASRMLHAAISADPMTPDELATAAGLRPWQREQLLDALWHAFLDIIEGPETSDDSDGSADR